MSRFRTSLLAAAAVVLPASSALAEGVALPTVPASVVANSGKVLTPGNASSEPLNEANEIVMKPGTTEIIPIARGHLNQIVTPFPEPEVIKSDENLLTTDVRNNVVYVGTNSESSVSMIVTPKGATSPSLNIVMTPKKIPPREVTFKLPEGVGVPSGALIGGSSKAGDWEQSQPYVDTIRDGLRMVATGKVPSGYSIRGTTAKDVVPGCNPQGGLLAWDFSRGQVVSGKSLAVFVGVVTANKQASGPVTLEEDWCAGADIAAVAFWPHPVLAPGESTEVYVVRRTVVPRSTSTVRPSLLGGQ